MRRRFLFLVSNYFPRMASVSGVVAVKRLCDELVRRGHEVHVFLTRRYEGEAETEVIDGATVHRGPFLRYPAAVRQTLVLTFAQHCPLPYLALAAAERRQAGDAKRRLFSLIETVRPDVAVSVCYPFHTHLLAAAAKKRYPLRWYAYYLDPFYNNHQYPVKNRRVLQRWEYRTLAAADRVFLPWCDLPEYADLPRAGRVASVEYPFITRTAPAPAVAARPAPAAGKKRVTCLYLGTLYPDIRNPGFMFDFFERAAQASNVTLVCVGTRPHFPAGYFEQWQRRLGPALQLRGPVPHKEVAALFEEMDILVSLGNTMANQMPSKIIEYANSGKPILHFYKTDDCPAKKFLQPYPLAFCVDETAPPTDETLRAFAAFCVAGAGQRVPHREVLALYVDYTIERVADIFLEEGNADG